MTTFILMHKNISVCSFNIDKDGNVTEWIIPKNTQSILHLPLPLKRVYHYINGGYILKENQNAYSINEEGMYFLEEWIRDRAIPITRKNLKQYTFPKNNAILSLMLNNHSLSLIDCYWTKLPSEQLTWSQVNLYANSKIESISDILKSKISNKDYKYNKINLTLTGNLEKFWFSSSKSSRDLSLAKLTEQNYDILSIREVIASKIYSLQGYKNHCTYKYIRNHYNQIVGCKCKAFTAENLELISVYDLLEEYGKTQSPDIYELIPQLASAYGANQQQIINQLDPQTLVDYLITNRDRHQNNIAFLRNPDTLQILTIAPIFDSGSSYSMENVLPLGVTNTTVHNLFNTELECLEHVHNIKALDINKLPNKNWIKAELNKMNNANEITTEKYLSLYLQKIDYIRYLQSK